MDWRRLVRCAHYLRLPGEDEIARWRRGTVGAQGFTRRITLERPRAHQMSAEKGAVGVLRIAGRLPSTAWPASSNPHPTASPASDAFRDSPKGCHGEMTDRRQNDHGNADCVQCPINGMAVFCLVCLENLIAIVAGHGGIGEKRGTRTRRTPRA